MSLHVESFGADCGPELVLLHGWAMHSGVWRGVRDGLAEHFHLHLVDLPGHGFSPACAFDSQGNTSDRLNRLRRFCPKAASSAVGRWVGR